MERREDACLEETVSLGTGALEGRPGLVAAAGDRALARKSKPAPPPTPGGHAVSQRKKEAARASAPSGANNACGKAGVRRGLLGTLG